jgi:SpoVK/Ycf46/Vps4 family AAA+-type ATPase
MNKRKKNNNYNTPFKIDNFNKYLVTISKTLIEDKCSNNNSNNNSNNTIKIIANKVEQPKPEIIELPTKKQTTKITEININVEINDINDILNLISTYKVDENVQYNINMKLLHDIKEPLCELNNMIGMKELKKNIVDQIIYFIQELNKSESSVCNGDFMHTVIYGKPGTGKTEIAKILGKIFSKIYVIFSKGTFKKVTRSDLIGGYLGQTAIKTKEVIKDNLGGILFIDEAYSLGNNEKKDSFSKECIDTLCEALSDHKDNLMVIIAGYEDELENCFFNYNQGLNSRFTWRFKTDDYIPEDLYYIFIKKVNDIGWSIHIDSKLSSGINPQWFAKNKEHFKFYGRDIETFLGKIKIAHSRRVFCKDLSEKKKITYEDMEKGLSIYLNNNGVQNRKETEYFKTHLQFSMYS